MIPASIRDWRKPYIDGLAEKVDDAIVEVVISERAWQSDADILDNLMTNCCVAPMADKRIVRAAMLRTIRRLVKNGLVDVSQGPSSFNGRCVRQYRWWPRQGPAL